MNISPNELRRQTVAVMKGVDAQMREVEETAASRGVPAETFKAPDGTYVMTPLLLAKSQCLATLTALQEPPKARRGG
jgi:hypothetical protein